MNEITQEVQLTAEEKKAQILVEKHKLLGRGAKAILEDVYFTHLSFGPGFYDYVETLGMPRSTAHNYQRGGYALVSGANPKYPANGLYKIGHDLTEGKTLEQAEKAWDDLVAEKQAKKSAEKIKVEEEALKQGLFLIEIPEASQEAYFALSERVIELTGAPDKAAAIGLVLDCIHQLNDLELQTLIEAS